MASLMQEKAGQLAASVPTADRQAEATGLRERLAVIFAAASEAKQAPVQDTAEIDELDGQLYLMMRDFFEAGHDPGRADPASLTTAQA